MAILVACLGSLAPALFILAVLLVMNEVFFRPKLGEALYNYGLALQPVLALGVEVALLALGFWGLDRLTRHPHRAEPTEERKMQHLGANSI
jgi:hypothetical protein